MGFHVGQRFGDYSITAVVGAGAMGRVYKVEHLLTRRTEAMKVLAAELATETQVKRFEREIRVLARLSHPNIATLHNALHSDNQLILLMEYIDGQTLESMFSGGRLPLDVGIGYIKQILSALAYAHRQGVVHRDVTPANVIITAGDEVKLTDFGLSKSYGDSLLTDCGEVLGSLPYLAPEQLKGTTHPDKRSDLYSVGAILYEHLTGRKPFGASRRLSAVLTDSEGAPQPPSKAVPAVSACWDRIVLRALARDPVHRYQSAEEFLEAIAQLDQPAATDLRLPQRRTLAIGSAMACLVVAAIALSTVIGELRSHPVEPVSMPWQRLHIVPPVFASVMSSPTESAKDTSSPVAKHGKKRARPVAPTSEGAALETANADAGVPTVQEPTAASASIEQSIHPPAATDATNSGSSTQAPVKKHFWSKLNIFKKKTEDAEAKK